VTRAELEAALQQHPTPELWSRYAALVRETDPRRADVIDLDAPGRRVSRAERRAALAAWLGPSWSAAGWNAGRFRHGLYDDAGHVVSENQNATWVATLLKSAAAGYISGLRLQSANLTPAALGVLGARDWPWLRALELDRFWALEPPPGAFTGWMEAMPNLERLLIAAHDNRFRPAVRHARLSVLTANERSVAFFQSSLPALHTLRLDGRVTWPEVQACCPALSRVEFLTTPQVPTGPLRGVRSVWFDARVTEPAPWLLTRLMTAFPEATLEVAGLDEAPVQEPRVKALGAKPWPSQLSLQRAGDWEAALRVTCGGVAMFLSLRDLVLAMERQFDRLDVDDQAAWRHFWSFVDRLGFGDETAFPRAPLADLARSLDDTGFTGRLGYEPHLTSSWGAFATRLEQHDGDTVIFMRERG
jgi:hypothetical protein